jgi:hypothetical protein
MSEMVERMARAIYETDPVGVRPWADAPASNREDCLACARAAIEPLYEPTAEMWAAVNLIERGHVSKICSVEGWRAMLDAAKVAP